MRAEICYGDDEVSVTKFRSALRRLGGAITEEKWSIGVTVYRVRIGNEVLRVFSDAYWVDLEGPDDLVRKVVAEYHKEIQAPSANSPGAA